MLALALLCLPADAAMPDLPATPNVVLIYVDDLGFGDVSCYGADAVRTPHIDRLAAEGTRFTDGHCTSATCTPSRYSLLTGEYAFRRQGTGIARGDAPAIITPGRETLPAVLKDAGYRTAVVGKWHLGLGPSEGEPMDWNGTIAPGPLEIGFDHCFLIPATGDRVPTVFVEDHAVVGLDPADPLRVSFKKDFGDVPTGKDRPDLLTVMKPSHGHNQTIVRGISRIGYMTGGESAWWRDEMIADRITQRAVSWIEKEADSEDPFFLFFSLHDIHVPRVPHPRFVGSTDMGPRGDVITETDWATGQILAALDEAGVADDTLVVFSSDNGPVVDDGYEDQSVQRLGDHTPAGPYRGGKYSNFEGGTRVPTITRWPGVVPAGAVSEALVTQIDLLASLAHLTGQSYDASSAPDTEQQLAAWLGHDAEGQDEILEHAKTVSLRRGDWKYIPPSKGPALNKTTNTELGNAPRGQLYDLAADPGETRNLLDEEPDVAEEMRERLSDLINR